MTTFTPVRSAIESYLNGALQLDELQEWLEDNIVDIDRAGEDEDRRLAADTWRIISEHGYGHRTEVRLREELGRLLPKPIRYVATVHTDYSTSNTVIQHRAAIAFSSAGPEFVKRTEHLGVIGGAPA
jgi:hypothetical protein